MSERKLPTIYTCFPGGKHKVLTMSYDDGKLEDRRLISIFNKYGIKGTFHLNSGLEMDTRIPTSEYQELYKGHEVSCHTLTHPTIARCSYSKEIINALPSLGIRYARTVTSTMSFAMPENFLEWNPTCHHNKNLLELGQQFVDLFKKQYLYMMYVWGHSYEFTNQNNWELMEDFCKLVGGRDDIWYATNIEIVDYLDAAKRLQYTADCSHVYNPSAASVWICVNDTNFIELKGGTMTELPIGEWAK